jgi:GntP family gluconate:H+ symporter
VATSHPFLVLVVGLLVVIGGIVVLRVNAFLALLTAALVVSFMGGPGATDPVTRVVSGFGATAGAVGIVIALAAIIGESMMRSGAADRIVRMFLDLLGEKRAATAMMSSGFVLSVPVFFDTAFYLLVPLARSMYRTTRHSYARYLVAIAAGGVATHALVPPTPGPLFVANALGVNVGVMILVGLVVALPAATAGLLYGYLLDRVMPLVPKDEISGAPAEEAPTGAPGERRLPSLLVSLLPIVLPILLIAGDAVVKTLAQRQLIAASPAARLLRGDALAAAIQKAAEGGSALAAASQWTGVLGNPSLALLFSAAIALLTLWSRRGSLGVPIPRIVEEALMSAGVIILITSAGGAFGAALREAGLGEAVRAMAEARAAGSSSLVLTNGLPLLVLAFLVAAIIRFAQGSTTTSMIVTSGMVLALADPSRLTVHPVYVALSIGAGALTCSWMNDSGFWIFARMGGLTETETLRSWTPLLTIVGGVGFLMSLLLAWLVPMAG